MLDVEQKYKDLFNTYGGKSIRLVFYKDEYRALYPSETLYPSEQLYPAEMSEDSIAFEITNEMVHTDTLTITESLCSDENLDFGACESAQMEIVISNPPKNISGMEFVLVISFAGFDLIRGIYTVESTPRENDRNTRRIIAYDRMRRFDNDVAGWYLALEFPMTLKEFRKSLCDFVGIKENANVSLINDDMIIEKTLEPESLNGWDVMRNICQINGVFGNIDTKGELQYITIPKKHNVTDTINRYKTVESEEYTVPDIDTIKVQKEEGDIGGTSSGGDDMNVYIIQGNFLVYGKTTSQMTQIANNILSVVSGLEYRPATIEGNGAPWYEMGDRIQVDTKDGPVNTIIMSRTSKGIQGSMDTIDSTGSQDLKRVFSIRTQVIEAKGLTAILKRTVEEVSNNLTNLEKRTESRFVQTAEQISAEVTRAKGSEEALSARIQINAEAITQRVTSAQAESLIEQKADSIRLKANAISWSSNNSSMTADGKLTCKEANISGNITAGSGKIGGFTISGNNLVSSSSGTIIQWGDFYVGGKSATIGSLEMSNDGLEVGYIGRDNFGHWESDTGDIYVHEVFPTDEDGWWKGWGVLETVRDLWDYVHSGGWDPGGGDCDGGGGCDGCKECETCSGNDCTNYDSCVQVCDSCSDSCDRCDSCDSCDKCDYCSGDCDGAEGPGCV